MSDNKNEKNIYPSKKSDETPNDSILYQPFQVSEEVDGDNTIAPSKTEIKFQKYNQRHKKKKNRELKLLSIGDFMERNKEIFHTDNKNYHKSVSNININDEITNHNHIKPNSDSRRMQNISKPLRLDNFKYEELKNLSKYSDTSIVQDSFLIQTHKDVTTETIKSPKTNSIPITETCSPRADDNTHSNRYNKQKQDYYNDVDRNIVSNNLDHVDNDSICETATDEPPQNASSEELSSEIITLFVDKFPPDISHDELEEVFKTLKGFKYLLVKTVGYTMTKPVAFATFENHHDANKAMYSLRDMLENKKTPFNFHVNMAKSNTKTQRLQYDDDQCILESQDSPNTTYRNIAQNYYVNQSPAYNRNFYSSPPPIFYPSVNISPFSYGYPQPTIQYNYAFQYATLIKDEKTGQYYWCPYTSNWDPPSYYDEIESDYQNSSDKDLKNEKNKTP